MDFLDIVSIVFACTAANHIGPIPDIEALIERKLPVIGCVKCLTFWVVLAYGITTVSIASVSEIAAILAISFLSAWSAIWLDLCMGAVDNLYIRAYDALYPTADRTDADALGTSDTMPDVSGTKEGNRDNIAANDHEDNP